MNLFIAAERSGLGVLRYEVVYAVVCVRLRLLERALYSTGDVVFPFSPRLLSSVYPAACSSE